MKQKKVEAILSLTGREDEAVTNRALLPASNAFQI